MVLSTSRAKRGFIEKSSPRTEKNFPLGNFSFLKNYELLFVNTFSLPLLNLLMIP